MFFYVLFSGHTLGSAQSWTVFFRLSFTFIVSYENGRNIENKLKLTFYIMVDFG